MRTTLLILIALACRPDLPAPAIASQLPYARQALDLGRTRDDAMYEAFSRSYALTPADAIDRAEVVTEFRRAVMIVRDHVNQGEYTFTEQDLAKAMAPYAGQVTVIVQVRLHPLHTYANTPQYDLYVETGPATRPLAPARFRRDAVLPLGAVGPGHTILAVRLEGTFPRADIEAASAPAIIVTDDQANVLWKTRLDLTRYR
jgi:hypothetical protein